MKILCWLLQFHCKAVLDFTFHVFFFCFFFFCEYHKFGHESRVIAPQREVQIQRKIELCKCISLPATTPQAIANYNSSPPFTWLTVIHKLTYTRSIRGLSYFQHCPKPHVFPNPTKPHDTSSHAPKVAKTGFETKTN